MNVTPIPHRIASQHPEAPATMPGGEDFNLRDPVRSFVQVVDRLILHPATFFARLRRRGDIAAPLFFAVIANAIGAGLGVLAYAVGLPGISHMFAVNDAAPLPHPVTIDIGSFHRTWTAAEPFGGGIGAAIVYWLAGVAGILLFIGMLHLAARLVMGPHTAGPEATFRSVAYASAPQFLVWVPFIGGLCGLYAAYLNVIGLRELHQSTTERAIWTFLAGIGLTIVVATLVALLAAALLIVFA
jgi:hypothetical protein